MAFAFPLLQYTFLLPLNSLKANIYGYIHLYDALKLYSLAARMGLNETGGNPNVTTDGRFLWNKMRRMSFPGMATSRNTQNKSSNNGSSSMESGKKEDKFPTRNGNLGGIGKEFRRMGKGIPPLENGGNSLLLMDSTSPLPHFEGLVSAEGVSSGQVN
jgi:hypothetical protein